MRQRITRVAPVQLGKVSAAFYAILSLPFAAIMGIASVLSPSDEAMPLAVVIVIPIFYVLGGFLFMVFGAWLYNVIAKWTGGIEFESHEISDT